jgi:hypothetical protein
MLVAASLMMLLIRVSFLRVIAMRAPAPCALIRLTFQTTATDSVAEVITFRFLAFGHSLAVLAGVIMLLGVREGFAFSEAVKLNCQLQSLPVFKLVGCGEKLFLDVGSKVDAQILGTFLRVYQGC